MRIPPVLKLSNQVGGLLIAGFLVVLLPSVPCPAASQETKAYQPQTDYQPAPSIIARLHALERPIEIVIFHGAWCKDCQREMPRFYRILEQADNPRFTVTEYKVNPQKQDVMGKFREFEIKMVPTFIFLEQGRELGRIVEKPQTTLEEDFLTLVTGGGS